jgi:diguanylate cyclase (GGDEF)-like protein
MHETLRLISIQHELGMAIGLDLRLKPMLKEFIKVAIKRLALSGIDFYIDSKVASDIDIKCQRIHNLSHVISVPMVHSCKNVTSIVPSLVHINTVNSWHEEYRQQSDTYTYYFKLADIGVICLHRKRKALEPSYLASLFPIFSRLAISCQASVEHEQMLEAIEARKIAEHTIKFQLLHDELTRLPNRRMLMDVLNKDIAIAEDKNQQGAVLFIDLDRFKAINDTLGHEVGDELLKTVAQIFLNSVRKSDLVARLSGDEFVLVIKDIASSREQAKKLVDKILNKIYKAFVQPIQAGEHLLHVSPSIGIEFYPWKDVSAEKILRNADTAMYIAKAKGHYAAVFYERQMSIDIERRLEVEKQLQQAVKTCEQFVVEYQPQFNNYGVCIGAEALTRWYSATGKFISPGLFIPVAEETGLIIELGNWVIKTACESIREFEQSGMPDSFEKISVNVSAVQFNQSQFVPNLIAQIESTKIDPLHLCIELTESALIHNVTKMREKIVHLKNYGIHVSVDDFGTGYSSLSYLNRFPISTLKIDQSFVRNMHIDSGNRAIVGTIIALAKSLSLSVIAEGVETIEELNSLQEVGCTRYQGFYFSKSIPFKSLVELVNTQI